METIDPNHLLGETDEPGVPEEPTVTHAEAPSGAGAFVRALGYEVLLSILWYSLVPIVIFAVLAFFSGVWSRLPLAGISLLLVILAMSFLLTWTTLRRQTDKPRAESARDDERTPQRGPTIARFAQNRKRALIGSAGAVALLLGGGYAISHLGADDRHDPEGQAQDALDQRLTDLLGSPVERLTCPEAEELARKVRLTLRYWHACGGQDQTLQESNECNVMQWDLMSAEEKLDTKIKKDCQ